MFSKKEIIIPYTVVVCTGCQMTQKREFVSGDVLFAESKCSCGKTARIEKIFGEAVQS